MCRFQLREVGSHFFRPDGQVMHPDAHQCREAEQFKVAHVRKSWQHVRTLFKV
jgi:hypothetical protein